MTETLSPRDHGASANLYASIRYAKLLYDQIGGIPTGTLVVDKQALRDLVGAIFSILNQDSVETEAVPILLRCACARLGFEIQKKTTPMLLSWKATMRKGESDFSIRFNLPNTISPELYAKACAEIKGAALLECSGPLSAEEIEQSDRSAAKKTGPGLENLLEYARNHRLIEIFSNVALTQEYFVNNQPKNPGVAFIAFLRSAEPKQNIDPNIRRFFEGRYRNRKIEFWNSSTTIGAITVDNTLIAFIPGKCLNFSRERLNDLLREIQLGLTPEKNRVSIVRLKKMLEPILTQ